MKPTKAIRENVREPAGGEVVLLVGPWVWGKGSTVEEAFTAMKKSGEFYYKDLCIAFHGHPACFVDEDGAIVSPNGQPPKIIARINRKRFDKVTGKATLTTEVY